MGIWQIGKCNTLKTCALVAVMGSIPFIPIIIFLSITFLIYIMRDIIKTKQGIDIKMFYNWMDCLYREYCPEREERERTLIKHRCSLNPGIYKCKKYQEFNQQLGINMKKIYCLDCL